MKTSVTKLVDVILDHLEAAQDKPPSDKAMRSLLMRKGYKRSDIDSALELINAHLSEKPVLEDVMPSVRQLAFFESTKVSMDVHHAMTRLELMGLLTPFEREMLLERFIHSEGQADMEALDFALSYVIGARQNAESQQAMLSVFDGYSPTLH